MPAIQINNVKKRYQSLQALKGISLSIEEGEFFGLLGPNGAGKTTLISIVAGLNRADSGTVAIHGHDVVSDYRSARGTAGTGVRSVFYGAGNLAHAVGLFRPEK